MYILVGFPGGFVPVPPLPEFTLGSRGHCPLVRGPNNVIISMVLSRIEFLKSWFRVP